MESQGHRDNILNPYSKEIGVGYAYSETSTYGDYWTADFAASPTSPTPGPAITCIDLSCNEYTFSTNDYISITADVQPISPPFYPYVTIAFPNGTTLYYVKDLGFTTVPTPYLGGGPFGLQNAINDYPVLATSYSIVQTGNFTLQGYATDGGGSVIGSVDSETLTVQ